MKDLNPWYKGSLPNWMLVALVSLIAFVGKGMLNDIREANQKNAEHAIRLSVLELQGNNFKDTITELKLSQKDILIELKNINMQLKQSR